MVLDFNETITAPATIPGTGAITIIRVSGPRSFEICDQVVRLKSGTLSEAPGNTIRFGNAVYPDGRVLDEVLVSIFRNPHSYTGEDSVEISCHASRFVAEEMLHLLCNAGAKMAQPGEFTRRAFVNGKMDLTQAEAVADVISSETSTSLSVALNQLKGGFSQELKALRQDLLEVTSLLELELDFSEEDVEFADRSRLSQMLDAVIGKVTSLSSSFRIGNAIRNGVPVAIVGPANSGKSSLLNSILCDQRAIVSDIPGTTRDTIEETVNIDGILYRFIDTAGLRSTSDEIERIGIDRSYQALQKASDVILVIDFNLPDVQVTSLISDIASRMDFSNQNLLILLNKSDIWTVNKNVSIINTFVASTDIKCDIFKYSTKSQESLIILKKCLSDHHKSDIYKSDQTLVTNARHYEALRTAAESLSGARQAIAQNLPPDLIAEHLRQAIHTLGTITGDITTDQVLGTIFSRFCIGK